MRAILTAAFVALLLAPAGMNAQDPGTVDVTGLAFLKYQQGEADGDQFSNFHVARSYFTARAGVLPRLSARITIDASQDVTGDFKARLKYAYMEYDVGSLASALTDLELEAGMAHMPWHGFEQSINRYRMREKMFAERAGLFNSADLGVTLRGNLFGQVGDGYQENVSDDFAGRYGSFEVGVYNGGGYHAIEQNTNKVVEGRLTVRPLPDVVPGLQLSGLAIVGKGNQPGAAADIPDWRTYNVFVSYQHELATFTAQYMSSEGNQKGTFVSATDPTQATDVSGYSFFGEGKLGSWRIIGGYDDVDHSPAGGPDRSVQRYHAGVGYVVTSGNVLLLSGDQEDWGAGGTDTRVQLVFQVKF